MSPYVALGAALFADVLLIRICLAVAFVFLLAFNVKVSVDADRVALDGILWALVTGAFHWVACWHLLKDEARLPKQGAPVCRLFYADPCAALLRILVPPTSTPQRKFGEEGKGGGADAAHCVCGAPGGGMRRGRQCRPPMRRWHRPRPSPTTSTTKASGRTSQREVKQQPNGCCCCCYS